jgi:probable phosphoglycerate mutase
MEGTRLIAVRHGETAWNVETRIQGQLDVPLNAKGRWQAGRVGQALADEPIDAIYSSDLGRAWETAQAIALPHGLAVTADLRLRERAFGSFEGRTFREIEAEMPDQAMRWRTREPEFAPGDGENLLDLRTRVTHAVSEIAARHPGQLVVLVAHGGVMDVIYRAATRLGLQAPRSWQLGNAAVNRLLWSPQGLTLVGWGDDSHLSGESLDESTA